MTATANFVAVDLGASSGRVTAGRWNGRRFVCDELHRFPNGGVRVGDHLYWNALGIWSQIQVGLSKYHSRFSGSPLGVGVDAWGVDFGLIDSDSRLLANPSHYRDHRTDGIPEAVFGCVPENSIFAETGVQTLQINTLFQLYSMVRDHDPILPTADRLLMIPDLYTFFLSGDKIVEYSEATTTQMYAPARGQWAREILKRLCIPDGFLPPPTMPGTVLSPVRDHILEECGFTEPFPAIAVASHDTASAVAAIPDMDEDSVFLSCGTWSLMGLTLREPNTSGSVMQLGFSNEGAADGSILLVKNITGLWILQECMRHWESEGCKYTWPSLIDGSAAERPFNSLIDPDAAEFQAPCDMPAAIRRYCVDTHQQVPETANAIARCAFESLSLKYKSVLHSLEFVTGRYLRSIRIVGGGCRNRLLCQMIADACNRQVISGPAEAAVLGNLMVQAIATRHVSGMDSCREAIADSVRCSTFDPRRSDQWDDAYERFRKLEAKEIDRGSRGARLSREIEKW